MNWIDAVVLGVVEGLTEFLPVSSTGHLILTNALLGIEGRASNVYTIVIQLGAILAVVTLYRARVAAMLRGIAGRDAAGLALFLRLFVAFLPAVVAGLLLEDLIDGYLFRPVPVSIALIAGGIAMIVVERALGKSGEGKRIEDLTFRDAALVGLTQCLALWPGTSRSMCTILGGRFAGLSTAAAAELSFLLALPTLGGATVYKLIKERDILFDPVAGPGIALIVVGNVVAFVVALAAVRWMVGFLNRHGMAPFGYYRIAIGVIFLALALAGWLSFAPNSD